jgi:hypothetical protein
MSWTAYGTIPRDSNPSSIAITSDGTVLVVGFEHTDGGTVRVFDFNGTTWIQRGGDLQLSNAAGPSEGRSVTISDSGTRVAFSSGVAQIAGGNVFEGVTEVYDWNGASWTLVGSRFVGAAIADALGWRIKLSSDGSTIALLSLGSDLPAPTSGHVEVHDFIGTDWVQRGSNVTGIGGDGPRALDLNANGSMFCMGSYQNDTFASNAGYVRVFAWNGSEWQQRGSSIFGSEANDEFGILASMSNNGNVVAASTNNGKARVYEWNGVDWQQRGSDLVTVSGSSTYGDCALNSDGSVLAHGDITTNGTVKTYQWDGSTWTQFGTTLTGPQTATKLGRSIALDGDANVMAIIGANDDGNLIDGTAVAYSRAIPNTIYNTLSDYGTPYLVLQRAAGHAGREDAIVPVRQATLRDRQRYRRFQTSSGSKVPFTLASDNGDAYQNMKHLTFTNLSTDTATVVSVRDKSNTDILFQVAIKPLSQVDLNFTSAWPAINVGKRWFIQAVPSITTLSVTGIYYDEELDM